MMQEKIKGIGSILFLILVFAGFTTQVLAQKGRSWEASPETVERVSKKNPTANFYEDQVRDFILPDPLALGGTTINSVAAWETENRSEILELFIQNVHGRVPDTPYDMTFNLVHEDKHAMDGKAT